jgi:uncharacterized protein YrzB (UPF0473 family)
MKSKNLDFKAIILYTLSKEKSSKYYLLKEINMSDKELLQEEEVIVLRSPDGDEVEFEEVASITINDKFYMILAPVEQVDGIDEDEALVFEVTEIDEENDNFELVTDDAIIDEVFKEYTRLLEETDD